MTNHDGNHVVQLQPRRQKGRNAPLPTYMFETTGVEVQVKRLGPFTMDEIRKKLLKDRKPPTPPVVQVEVGDARMRVAEPNPADPTYIREYQEYQEWLQSTTAEKMIDLMVNYCIVCEPDPDVVEEKRSMLAMIDPEINERQSDKEVYVRYYLLATTRELTEVQQFILGQSMPTPEAVQAHIETFPGAIQGEGPVQTPGTPIRAEIQP